MPATTKGAWRLQEVRDAVLCGEWINYNIKNDPGSLWMWGQNCFGELGLNTDAASTNHRSSPTQIPGNWVSISMGDCYSLAIKEGGTLWSWGRSTCGQLGDGVLIHRSSPVQVPGTTWCAVAAGSRSSFAIKRDNTLWGWSNLCLGGNLASSPVQVPGTSWCSVVTNEVTLALKTDGTLWSWGENNNGFIGDNTAFPRSSPVQIPGNSWTTIKNGTTVQLALKSDGTLWVWGQNGNGRLGDGTVISRSSPVQVPGVQWNDISAGSGHTFARKTDGTLWGWGCGYRGSLGQNDMIHRSSPVQIPGASWTAVSTSLEGTRATKTDGTMWVWGGLLYGSSGLNLNYVARSSPVQLPGTQWSDVCGAGWRYNVSARKSYSPPLPYDINGNHLYTWGDNSLGQLGDNTLINRSSPVLIPGYQWCKLSAGTFRTLGIKTDNTLWAWGQNTNGSFGDGTLINRSSPIQISGNQWCNITASFCHTLALKTDGTLWAWGDAGNGRLGTNESANVNKSSPVQVPGTTWCAVNSRMHTSHALKTDGTLWSWGCGSNGELGNDTNNHTSSPVQVPGTSWCAVSGHDHVLGIKTDNTLWVWGQNAAGDFGIPSIPNLATRSSPVQIPGNSWCKAVAGNKTTLAIKTDGTLWAWGCNNLGQLGVNGGASSFSSPVQVPGNQWCEVSNYARGTTFSSAALKTDNTLWTWGEGTSGVNGDNTTITRSSPIQIPGCWIMLGTGETNKFAVKCYVNN